MNIKTDDLKIVGKGATSDVFLLDDQRVIKLFNKNYSKDAVDYEADIARKIQDLNIPAPKIYGTVTVDGRYGIIYEYIRGIPLFDELLQSKKNIKKIIEELVCRQLEINNIESRDLPVQRTRFKNQIARTDLSDEIKEKINTYLSVMPVKNNVCHGDFHAGNIVRADNQLIILDWMNCYAGNREGDLIRSILMMESPYIPVKLRLVQKLWFMSFKKKAAGIYKKTVLSKYKIKKYRAWLTVVAAVRLCDNVPGEDKWLKRIIQKNIKYLSVRL